MRKCLYCNTYSIILLAQSLEAKAQYAKQQGSGAFIWSLEMVNTLIKKILAVLLPFPLALCFILIFFFTPCLFRTILTTPC